MTNPPRTGQMVGEDKMSVMFSVSHKPGSLSRVLQLFHENDINLTCLESRPSALGKDFNFYSCFEGFEGEPHVEKLLAAMQQSEACTKLTRLSSKKVPWFPTRMQDLDDVANEILDAGTDLESDHPGFNDTEYRARREMQAELALNYRHGEPLPRVQYTDDEIRTWGTVYDKLKPLLAQYACKEHVNMLPLLEKHCGYSNTNIPQAADISAFMEKRSGFTLRPVAGLLSARHFLYGLAFRVFFSTQYIRHHSKPLYTPEPDICHELMGHAPMFADPDFADFSQEIGLASIGATDEQIEQLARCYWFTVEFGLCNQNGERKAFGAGLLSSFGELEYSMSSEPEIREWDPFDAAQQEYPITTYQPIYYLAESFEEATRKMKEFSTSFARPFNVRYNIWSRSIEVDRNLELMNCPTHKDE